MENTIAKKKRAFPNTWIIIAAMVAIVAILSWIVPSGSYDYEQVDVNGTMRNVAIDGTYHVVDKSETKPTGFLATCFTVTMGLGAGALLSFNDHWALVFNLFLSIAAMLLALAVAVVQVASNRPVGDLYGLLLRRARFMADGYLLWLS